MVGVRENRTGAGGLALVPWIITAGLTRIQGSLRKILNLKTEYYSSVCATQRPSTKQLSIVL